MAKVRPEERGAVAWSFTHFLLLLASWYAIRPVRDAMGIEGGIEHLPWMFTATFVATILAVPAFSALVARLPVRHVIPVAYHALAAGLVFFALAPRLDLDRVLLARCFYVWATVYSLFVVSAFWSLMSDAFTTEQGTRIFAAVAAGGSLGGLVGPLLAVILSGQGNGAPLLAAALLLEGCAACTNRLMRWSQQHGRGALAHHEREPVGGSVLGAPPPLLRNPYLLGIAGIVLFTTMTSSLLYLQQAQIVRDAFATSADRVSFFARMDLVVNATALVVQLLLTAPVIARLGLAFALAVVPLLTGAGFVMLATIPTLAVLVGVQALRRALHYGFERPAREILFTVAGREERYKTKSLVDTVVYRGGDAAGGWTHAAFAAMGAGAALLPLAAMPLVLAWLLTIPWLVRRHRRLAQDLPEGRTSWSVDVATSSSSP